MKAHTKSPMQASNISTWIQMLTFRFQLSLPLRFIIKFILLALLVVPTQLALAQPVNGDDATTMTSKIPDITIYADRARVTRTGKAALRAGTTRFAFRKLPGWIDEGSVRVSLTPTEVGELVDVQIEKTFLAKSDDEEILKAEAAVTEISDQLAALDDETAALDAEQRQTDAIRAFSLDKLPKDAAVREIKIDEMNGMVKFIGTNLLDISRGKRAIERRRRDLQPELRARQKKLNDLRARSQLEQRTVFVAIKAARDVEATIALNYLLPGTTWEPVHEVRTAQDGASLTVASYAIVTQTTGEDWDGANLTFSTQRPNTTTRIPELEAQLIGGARSLARVLNSGDDTFQQAAANFSAQNSLWNGMNNENKPSVQMAWDRNVREQQDRQSRQIVAFQQVQQRGTTAQFPALGLQTVRTDGRAVRVPIGTARLAATPRIVAAPELSLNAAQTAEITNSSGQPLLPGKVLLFTEGAFVGTTETEFVAPGENSSLFLGVADNLKLSRTLDQKRSSVTWTGKRKRMTASFVVSVENLSAKPAVFQLSDRVPVSETDDIRVYSVKLQPDIKPDTKGLFKWDVKLNPKEKKDFRIEYTVDYPAEMPVVAANANPGMGGAGESSQRLYRELNILETQVKK